MAGTGPSITWKFGARWCQLPLTEFLGPSLSTKVGFIRDSLSSTPALSRITWLNQLYKTRPPSVICVKVSGVRSTASHSTMPWNLFFLFWPSPLPSVNLIIISVTQPPPSPPWVEWTRHNDNWQVHGSHRRRVGSICRKFQMKQNKENKNNKKPELDSESGTIKHLHVNSV